MEEFTNEMAFSNEPSGPPALNSEAKARVIESFRKFDLNGDAMISKEELKEVLKTLAPHYWNDEKAGKLFSTANINNDDHISYKEFAEHIFEIAEKPTSNLEEPLPFLDKPVVITHAGNFFDEYLFAAAADDGDGRRYVYSWTKGGSPKEDPQAHWKIMRCSSNFLITHAGSFAHEYLYATQHNDGNGRRYIHTWMKDEIAAEDPQAHWKITQLGSYFIITHARWYVGEYFYATQHNDGNGRRYIHTWMNGGSPEEDGQAHWLIIPLESI